MAPLHVLGGAWPSSFCQHPTRASAATREVQRDGLHGGVGHETVTHFPLGDELSGQRQPLHAVEAIVLGHHQPLHAVA